MLTKLQADAAAEALFSTELDARQKARKRRAGLVPFFMRTNKSSRLERGIEWEFYRQAQRRTLNNWRITAASFVYLVILVGVWNVVDTLPISAWSTIGYYLAVVAPSAVRLVFIRREFSRIVRGESK